MLVFKDLTLPCIAVIFTSVRSSVDKGYAEMAAEIEALVHEQEGFIAMESVHDSSTGDGITVCYWNSIEDVKRWKEQTVHQSAQERGRAEWYNEYAVRIAEVTQSYDFS